MIKIDGEVIETSCPPNRADSLRTVTVWLPETEESMDFTFSLEAFQKSGIKTGDKILIQIDKRFDVDTFTQSLFKSA